jgi:IclR family acetate operon transcriptional repressor
LLIPGWYHFGTSRWTSDAEAGGKVRAVSATDGPAYPIESVDRALTVILAFEDADTLTITEIGHLLRVSRSTAYRLLTVLEHRGFVRQDPRTKAFRAGTTLLRVGLAAARRSDVRAVLRPLLQEVVDDVGETAHVVMLDRGEAFYMDCVESSQMVRATSRVGTSLPAHVTAAGKVLLAALPEARLDELLTSPLESMTRRSKTSPTSVRREVQQVASRGWALNDGESEPGLRAVAVLVPSSQTELGIDAAITVAGPSDRMDERRVEEIAGRLRTHVAAFRPMAS